MPGTHGENEHDRQEGGLSSGEDDFLYLYVPPGRYEMPRQTIPMDLNYLQRLLPGSEMRQLSKRQYRRLKELERERKQAM